MRLGLDGIGPWVAKIVIGILVKWLVIHVIIHNILGVFHLLNPFNMWEGARAAGKIVGCLVLWYALCVYNYVQSVFQ